MFDMSELAVLDYLGLNQVKLKEIKDDIAKRKLELQKTLAKKESS